MPSTKIGKFGRDMCVCVFGGKDKEFCSIHAEFSDTKWTLKGEIDAGGICQEMIVPSAGADEVTQSLFGSKERKEAKMVL